MENCHFFTFIIIISMLFRTISLVPENSQRLFNLCGVLDENLRQIENAFDNIFIKRQNFKFKICYENNDNKNENENENEKSQHLQTIYKVCDLLENLYKSTDNKNILKIDDLQLQITETKTQNRTQHQHKNSENSQLLTKKANLKARTPNQQQYINAVQKNDICFGIGPAGTGKTYLAVACAVDAFEREIVERIILTRPAVEAGERLGFLPGDLNQKVDPYLRPLYDSLYSLMGVEKVMRLMEKQIIEIAPLAFMRGRTLNRSFVILDEAQNTTCEQMKMFLTRIGIGTKAVITGDITQIDLPKNQQSGLKNALDVLKNIKGLDFVYFQREDVVRHPLVARIVEAYETTEKNKK